MELDFDKLNGLVPAIVQDFESGEVLMLGFMNKEALVAVKDVTLAGLVKLSNVMSTLSTVADVATFKR